MEQRTDYSVPSFCWSVHSCHWRRRWPCVIGVVEGARGAHRASLRNVMSEHSKLSVIYHYCILKQHLFPSYNSIWRNQKLHHRYFVMAYVPLGCSSRLQYGTVVAKYFRSHRLFSLKRENQAPNVGMSTLLCRLENTWSADPTIRRGLGFKFQISARRRPWGLGVRVISYSTPEAETKGGA